MAEALGARSRLGDEWHTPKLLGQLGETQLAGGDATAARARIDRGLALTAATGARHYEAELRRLRAACLRTALAQVDPGPDPCADVLAARALLRDEPVPRPVHG